MPPKQFKGTCPRCDKEIRNKRNFDTHVNICLFGKRKSLSCSICGNAYSHQSTLSKHRKACLENARCNRSYTDKLNDTTVDSAAYNKVKSDKNNLKLEKTFFVYFESHTEEFGNISKQHFVFLLIDPRTLSNSDRELNKWRSFLESIFYIGHGHGGRTLQHLLNALRIYKRDDEGLVLPKEENGPNDLYENDKTERILEIWRNGRGVMCPIVQNWITIHEAESVKSCMINAIGLDNLTNPMNGEFYGPPANGLWSESSINQFGVEQLHNTFERFGRQTELRPDDALGILYDLDN